MEFSVGDFVKVKEISYLKKDLHGKIGKVVGSHENDIYSVEIDGIQYGLLVDMIELANVSTMKLEVLPPIPAGESPFIHDAYHMGAQVASNVYIMHETHKTQKAKYIIVVNTETGERSRIWL